MKWWNELPAKTQALIAVLSGISFLSIAIGLGIVFGPHVAALLILVPLFLFIIVGLIGIIYSALVYEFEYRKKN